MVKGYKVFSSDWTCRDKQYACPGNYEEEVELRVCERGMHFCKKAADCFRYYPFDSENHVAEVIAYGDVLEDGNKCCTNKLEIVRELSWHEVLDLVNTGKGCTGIRNSGSYNSGSWNSGSYNSGSWNSGSYNSGSWNSGDFSNGCFNTIEPKIYLFDKPSGITYRDWRYSKAEQLLRQMPLETLEYVDFGNMTDDEKAVHPEAETTGGYLRKVKSRSRQEWWQSLTEAEKETIKAIPNFDADIFREITGIDVAEGE